MNINDYLPNIQQDDTIKIYNISKHETLEVNNKTLTSIVKLIGIKRNTITFYI